MAQPAAGEPKVDVNLQPFCLLGRALQAAGHTVSVGAQARFKAYVESFDLAYRTIAGDDVAALENEKAVAAMHSGGVPAFFKVMNEWRYKLCTPELIFASAVAAARGADLIVTNIIFVDEAGELGDVEQLSFLVGDVGMCVMPAWSRDFSVNVAAACVAESAGVAFAFVNLTP